MLLFIMFWLRSVNCLVINERGVDLTKVRREKDTNILFGFKEMKKKKKTTNMLLHFNNYNDRRNEK